MEETLHREYQHLSFVKNWKPNESSWLLLGQCEALVKAINNTPILPHHYAVLMQLALLKGAQSTTAIEGNTLSDEEIKKLMEGLKLPPSKEYQEIEVKNILEAFNILLKEVTTENKDQLINVDLLKRFHKLVGKNLGEHFSAIPGQLRDNDVVVGPYRCPDHRDVPVLLDKLCKWLREEFGYEKHEQSFKEVVIQAIVAHLYIEWIHPFSDGNGRTGRLVEFYVLLRGGNPDIASHILSNYYNQTRPEYYRQIEKAREDNDLSGFIHYALLGFRDGLEQTLEIIQKSQFENTWQKLIYDKFDEVKDQIRDVVFKRLRTLALELPFNRPFNVSEIPNLTIPLAKAYASLNEKTIQRDIERLVELKLVLKFEEKFVANTDSIRSMFAKKRIRIIG
jgi:Fic family protein